MAVHTAVSWLLDKYVLSWEKYRLRKKDREICREHPDWVPLTKEELSRIDRKDRFGYTICKNMAPEGSDIDYFVPKAEYLCDIVPALNPYNHLRNSMPTDCIFSDKNYHELFMRQFRFPKTVIRRIGKVFYDADYSMITPEQAGALLQEHDVLVFKQTVESGHGEGIRRLERADFEGVYMTYSDDYIVQELVHQHPVLAYFNPSCVNVLRLTTLFWRGDVYLLGGILRVGAPGAFCDHENRGGEYYLSIPLADDGTILPRPVDVESYTVRSDCHGTPVKGVIPGYENIRQIALEGHSRYPQYKLIGWDITIDEDGRPLVMEFNTKFPGLNGTQCALGPVLKQNSVRGVPLLDEIRADLFGARA